jgi:hypothetical protein
LLNTKLTVIVSSSVTHVTVKILGGDAEFFLGFSCSDMVMECGQTEERETMELLKELPTDKYHELMQTFMKSLLQYMYESWRHTEWETDSDVDTNVRTDTVGRTHRHVHRFTQRILRYSRT